MKFVLLLSLLCAAPADADHNVTLSNSTHAVLPNGLTIEIKNGELFIDREGLRAPIPLPDDKPGYRAPAKRLTNISTTDNRAWTTIRWTDSCGFEDQLQIKLNALYARTENELGLIAYKNKAYAQAVPYFSHALQMDAEYDEAAINLAKADAMAGKTQEALDALEPVIQRDPARVYLHCLIEPDLNNLLATQRIAGLTASLAGTAQLSADDVISAGQSFSGNRLAAYEPVRALVAAVDRTFDTVESGDEEGETVCPWKSSLHIVEAKTGRTLARFPLVTETDTAKNESCLKPSPAPKAAAEVIAGRVALANRALSSLGFTLPDQQRAESAPKPAASPDNPALTFTELDFPSDDLRLLAYADGHAELKRVDLDLDRTLYVERVDWAAFLPAQKLVVFQWGQFPSQACPEKHLWGGIGVLKP